MGSIQIRDGTALSQEEKDFAYKLFDAAGVDYEYYHAQAFTKEQKRVNSKTTKLYMSDSEMVFIAAHLAGFTLADAYVIGFPHAVRHSKNRRKNQGLQVLRRPHVQRYISDRRAELSERLTEAVFWDRQNSVEALRLVIEHNIKDLRRFEEAREQELAYLESQIMNSEEVDPELMSNLFKAMRRRSMNETINRGIVAAVSELNKMYGFSGESVNLTAQITFSKDDDIPD